MAPPPPEPLVNAATPPVDARDTEEAPIAPPPAMPVQSALYIAPDGTVSFGALFAELVPVARALDPSFRPDSNRAEAPAVPANDVTP